MLSDTEMLKIHAGMLELLVELQRICIENDIKYSLLGGTLLGAVRENGFIPWDDDADVCFVREEYEKFKRIINQGVLKKEIKFYEYKKGKRNPTLILKRESEPLAWLDIIILDFVSEKKVCQILKICIAKTMCLSIKTQETMKASCEKTKKGIHKNWELWISYIPYLCGKIIPFRTKNHIRDWLMKNILNGKKKKMFRSNDAFKTISIILNASLLNTYILIQFENTQLMVFKNFHEVLVTQYGEDYMIPKKIVEEHTLTRNIW